MQIAKIIASLSHIEYLARVTNKLEVESPPQLSDYGLGQFVSVDIESKNIIGVISNTELINPDFTTFSLRLSSEEKNQLFSPDYLQEQGIMIKILILGYLEGNVATHKAPVEVLSPQSSVKLLEREDLKAFHQKQGKLFIGYYTQVMRMGGLISSILLSIIIEKLLPFTSQDDEKKLTLLKQNLSWQQTISAFPSRK